jgi:hypothetical protein
MQVLTILTSLVFAASVQAQDQQKANEEANVFNLADVTNTSTADDVEDVVGSQ